MIVKMKKISLVALDFLKEESLDILRDAGIMHLNLTDVGSDKVAELNEKKSIFEKSLMLLTDTGDKKTSHSEEDINLALEIAERLNNDSQKIFTCHEEISNLEREIAKASLWGDFDYSDIEFLKEKHIDIRFYQLNKDQFNNIPDHVKIFVINRTKSTIRLAAVFTDDNVELPFEEASIPERSLSQLNIQLTEKRKELEAVQQEIAKLSKNKSRLQWGLEKVDELLEFENAVSSMSKDGKIAYITGYIPEKEVDGLKNIAAKDGWGIMISDPSDDDKVPTFVENPKWINAISPVFNLLGTIPGYKEFDISLWFLLFFSVFWAMIIGDAGYGLLFLLFTIIGRIIFKKATFEPFLLLTLTSITTIVWGGITGNWFGVEAFTQHEAFSWMIMPSIASFASVSSGGTDKLIMHLCFLIGGVHLSVAHLLSFFRLFPSLKSYSEIGRLSVIWGLYFLIRTLVLKIESHPACFWLLGSGFFLIIIFSEQDGKFFKGLKNGFSNLILISLDGVGFFSDVVSYVRLFAVGLATLEVAKSFNAMASTLGSGAVAIIGSAFILFCGHGLNIILGAMSLIVHGVRLNMLEFSGHLNMEWSGQAYKPFKK